MWKRTITRSRRVPHAAPALRRALPARLPRPLVTAVLTALLATAACVNTATSTCADGLRCPAGKVCVAGIDAPDRCEPANLVLACEGKSDAEACLHSSGTLALCQGGVCTPVACGNDYVEMVDTVVEVCDDGNTEDNDGCSADCQRPCGDTFLQTEHGEICDSAPPPGQHCVDQGFDMGTLGCADSCTAVNTDACISFGWQPTTVSVAEQQSWHFLRTWVVSPTQVFAVGVESNFLQDPASHLCATCGRIFYYDGNTWTVAQEGMPTLLGLWGSGPEDIYAAGLLGHIWHFDGHDWSQMEVEEEYHLGAVWGSGPNDVFAAGTRWQRGTDVRDTAFAILHYDGNPEGRWVPMDLSQAPDMPEAKLFGISGSGSGEVLAVGTEGTILRYDGNPAGTWVPVSPRLDDTSIDDLIDIWSPGDGSAIVVGKNGTILRYAGGTGSPDAPDARWSVMETPTRANLLGVWGDGHGQIFAVGVNGTLLHHDAHAGDGWTLVDSGTTYHLAHVHGSSVGNILAVGQNGTVLRSGGTDWATMSLPENQGNVNDIWGSDPDCVYAATGEGGIWHYDGNSAARWVPMISGTDEKLRSVHGLGCGDEVYAVGTSGTILRYANDTWTAMASPTNRTMNGVWAGARDAVFAVGDGGTILRYDGNPEGRWVPMDTEVEVKLWAVWGTSANDVFAVGRDGTILHYDGTPEGWSALDIDTELHLYHVWGSASDDVFAVGATGVIVHYDGEQWQRMDSEYFAYLESVWGSGPDDVFAAGQGGMLLHFDGTRWSPVRPPVEVKLQSVWSPPQGKQLLVAGEDGRIHRLTRYRN